MDLGQEGTFKRGIKANAKRVYNTRAGTQLVSVAKHLCTVSAGSITKDARTAAHACEPTAACQYIADKLHVSSPMMNPVIYPCVLFSSPTLVAPHVIFDLDLT